jgi:photosystem II stability/assembly factor-like uncharacterized protein
MGLAGSQHIGRILVDPRDSKVVLVAAEGPLWSAGGERGVYRSSDGGATWTAALVIDENTGVTDLEFDPSNPDVVYAASYQRRRHVWGFMGGGPRSGIWKSSDNGKTWRQIRTGLPKGDMGKIGLAVTAADPNLVYATIEAVGDEKGFYRSRDKGESWERRNGYISGGTGPHYYQEIEASPVNPDLVYQMDVFLRVTRDGGATFSILETAFDKHSDNHALVVDPADGKHLLVGTDAGVYESFDEGTTWRHFPNLPVSQFYKVALSNREPFYDVLVGAQDLGTLHGPSRTTNRDGIRNQDWYVPLGADGYGVAFHPADPAAPSVRDGRDRAAGLRVVDARLAVRGGSSGPPGLRGDARPQGRLRGRERSLPALEPRVPIRHGAGRLVGRALDPRGERARPTPGPHGGHRRAGGGRGGAARGSRRHGRGVRDTRPAGAPRFDLRESGDTRAGGSRRARLGRRGGE